MSSFGHVFRYEYKINLGFYFGESFLCHKISKNAAELLLKKLREHITPCSPLKNQVHPYSFHRN